MVPFVVSLNTSPGGIPKRPQRSVEISAAGLAGDGHDHEKHNTPVQAVSLLDIEDLEDLRAEGFDVGPGATGENITLRGLEVDTLSVGDKIDFEGGVTIELTKRRKPCFVLDSIDAELKNVFHGRCGYLARVITPGRLDVDATLTVRRVETATS